MKIADYLVSGLRGIAAAAWLSCAGPTLATRTYAPEGSRKENAYLNMKDILTETCGVEFTISPAQGFRCMQQVNTRGNYVTSHFNWDEIEQIECLGRIIKITGKYDSSTIYTHGPVWKDSLPQCHDLEKAMKIYLEERKK